MPFFRENVLVPFLGLRVSKVQDIEPGVNQIANHNNAKYQLEECVSGHFVPFAFGNVLK